MKTKNLLFLFFLFIHSHFFAQKSNPDKLGLLIIDAQKWYIPGHPESMYVKWNITGHDRTHQSIITSMDSVLQWANSKKLPVVVTYEADNKGAYNLPDELVEDLDSSRTTHYTKFFYDATKHSEFEEIILKSEVSHWVIIGAETDVCVYQTTKGLLRLGKKVTLINEAIYSGRNNTHITQNNLRSFGANFMSIKQLYDGNFKANTNTTPVEDPFNLPGLSLVIFPFNNPKNQQPGTLKRLTYLQDYANIIGLKIQNPDSVLPTSKVILVAGDITAKKLNTFRPKNGSKIIVLADCSSDLNDIKMEKNWQKHTLKSIFYELMETVSFYFKSPDDLQGWQKNLKQAIDNGKLNYVESLQNE